MLTINQKLELQSEIRDANIYISRTDNGADVATLAGIIDDIEFAIRQGTWAYGPLLEFAAWRANALE